MSRSRLLLALLAALLAAGLLTWGFQARAPVAPPGELESDEPVATSEQPDLLTAEGSDIAGGPIDGTAGGGAGAYGQRTTPARLTGRVLDETGRPIAGATVRVREIDPNSLRGAPFADGDELAFTTSDRDGAFTLDAPANRWLRVEASASGRATVAHRVASAGAYVEIVLPPAGTLLVRVLDHVGATRHGVDLQVVSGETILEASSGRGGIAKIDFVRPGSVRVRATWVPSGAHTVAGPFAVRAGATTEALIVIPRGIDVEGRVLDDATGKPIAGALVHVSHPGRSDAAKPTDADGAFGPLAGGSAGERVFLAVRAEGYAPLLEPVVLRRLGQQEVVLRLVRGEPWTGLVQLENGKPAAGAVVGYTADGVAGRAPAETVADAQGRFTLPPPPPPAPGRRIVLVARTATGLGALALRPDTPRPASVLITVAEGSVVQGRVTDTEGQALAGATVRLTPAWDEVRRGAASDAPTARLLAVNEAGFVGLSSATGADGRWLVRAVPAGPYRVVFEHDGARHPRAADLDVRGASVDAGVERLGAGRTLEGRVRDERGEPLAGAVVRVAPDAAGARPRRTDTASDGTFVVRGLAPGRHRVTATYGDRDPLRGVVDIEAGEDALIALDFDAAAGLAATVRDGAKPYTGVLVIDLHGDSGAARTRRTVRAHQGAVRLADLPTGTYSLAVWAPDRRTARVEGVDLLAGQTTNVDVPLGAAALLRGVVRTPDGEAVPSARVSLEPRGSGGRRRVLATADAHGIYCFHELEPASYTVVAAGRGGGPAHVEVVLAVGDMRALDLKLTPAGTLDVEVVDARGRPVPAARVAWRGAAGTSRSPTPVRTDLKGRVTLRDVPADVDVTVSARAPDGRTASERATVSAGKTTRVVIRLPATD